MPLGVQIAHRQQLISGLLLPLLSRAGDRRARGDTLEIHNFLRSALVEPEAHPRRMPTEHLRQQMFRYQLCVVLGSGQTDERLFIACELLLQPQKVQVKVANIGQSPSIHGPLSCSRVHVVPRKYLGAEVFGRCNKTKSFAGPAHDAIQL